MNIILIASLLFAFLVPHAQIITVDTASELTAAISTAQAGDVIQLRGGTYAAPATGWQFANSSVTLINYPGEQAVLFQPAMDKSGNYIIKCLQSSPAVDGNKIIGSDVGGQKGIVMQGNTGAISPAILAYKCDDWEVAGIEFRGVGYGIFTRKVDNGKTSADGWYVHDNFVSDYFRESGMQFNGNGNRIENNVIVKATSQYTSTYGCQLLNLLGNNNIVRGNHLERVSQSVRCIGVFFEWDLSDANLIENNSIVGVVNGVSFFGGDNNTVRNNVLTGTDTAFVIRSWAEGTTAYPCNFSSFMPLESDTDNPDWGYMYPHDCRSKSNRFENNAVSGFANFSAVNLPEPSNVFVTTTVTPDPTDTATMTLTASPTITKTQTATPTGTPGDVHVDTPDELIAALENVRSGDTIYVHAGTYPAFEVLQSGITLTAAPGERPVISGGGGVKLRGDNITFAGFEVVGMTTYYGAGVVSYGDGNVITGNTVHDNGGATAGIMVAGGQDNQILDNIVYENGFFGIGIYNSDGGNIIDGNTSYGHTLMAGDSDGIHCSISSENTISNNVVFDNSDDGIDMWSCSSNIVSGNTAHHNGGTGDGNGFKLGYGGLNTVTSNIAYENFACGFTSNGGGNYYENNTAHDNGTCGFEDDWRVSGNTQTSQFINNMAWGNPGGNFNIGKFTTVFEGNTIPTVTPLPVTPTYTATPSLTPTATQICEVVESKSYVITVCEK